MENVFFTQTKWRQIGGLGSLLKIIWEQKKSQIIVHGPVPMAAVTKRILATMNLPPDWEICKFNETIKVYEDSAIRIVFMPLQCNDDRKSKNISNGIELNFKCIMIAIYLLKRSIHGNGILL